MNNKYTLKKLADIGAKAANSCLPDYVSMCVLNGAPPHHVVAREAFTKAILDAIGYEFPKDKEDEEREAFDAWCNANYKLATTDQFEAWKAGREELRRAIKKPSYSTPEQIVKSIQNLTTKEPAWIPWFGYDKSPIPGKQTRYEVEYRDGAKALCVQNTLRWAHHGTAGDIIAYRILEP
jgi:hypothetical protein